MTHCRVRLTRWLRRRSEPGAAILLYHRIAQPEVDPWELAVSPAHFGEHLEVLQRRASVLRLSSLVDRLRAGTVPARSVVVTFDDGYADNLHAAKPVLERYDVPATIFVTTGALDARRELWWDELESTLLSPGELPPVLELEIDGTMHRWLLGEAASYTPAEAARHRQWRPRQAPPTTRHGVFVELWRRLQRLDHARRVTALDRLAAASGRSAQVRPAHRTLTEAELRELAASASIDIGAHTVTHPRLATLSPSDQQVELAASRQHLERVLDRPITALAYPHGGRDDYDATTVRLARESGYACACAARGGAARSGAVLHELPRCFVPDVDGDTFEKMLDRWLQG